MLYLIKRASRPFCHRAPYHPVIICDRKWMADWEAGCTCRQAWIWTHDIAHPSYGWLLVRWQGLDIDLGHVVHACTLPDGTTSGISHKRDEEPWSLLPGAVWWSDRPIPAWLLEAGVVYPPDGFTQQWILDHIADEASDREHQRRLRECPEGGLVATFSASGFGREIPPHWPQPVEGEWLG